MPGLTYVRFRKRTCTKQQHIVSAMLNLGQVPIISQGDMMGIERGMCDMYVL